MNELDEQLRGLQGLPIHPRINRIGDGVIYAAGVRRDGRIARRQMLMSASLALVIGVASSVLPGENVRAAVPHSDIFGTSTLAPSQLLGQ
ncbi:hypothetical protein [Aquisediminimonas sediminicola]|uniref:hypothetical protein n=1 Tax=Alteraquisediminimonas sediminicola TaxID=2676787 RepID=UPI001C8D4E16|nr:hypothetical protein [Aquisediminimonas sediminicola]